MKILTTLLWSPSYTGPHA